MPIFQTPRRLLFVTLLQATLYSEMRAHEKDRLPSRECFCPFAATMLNARDTVLDEPWDFDIA